MNNPIDFDVDMDSCECADGCECADELLLSKIWRAEAEVTSLSHEDVFGRDEMV